VICLGNTKNLTADGKVRIFDSVEGIFAFLFQTN
jgi:hypothetical protein